jgi:sirohydrochlorin ferrochelatase
VNAGSATALRERPQDIGLVVVDHGSRRQESNEMLERMADMIRESVPYRIVEPAHMELAEPSIATAYARCVAADVELVVISPYFLLPGRHWSQDIPELARQAANEHPGSRYLVTAPLGLHPLMAQVVDARVRHCLAHAGGTADECEVCEGTGVCAISAG